MTYPFPPFFLSLSFFKLLQKRKEKGVKAWTRKIEVIAC